MYTDNLSLKSLFNEKQPVPVQAAGRIQRWALALANYEYTMAFRPTHKHSNADALSRLPTESVEIEEPIPTELVNLMEAMDKMPITGETIKVWTQKDPLLARVYKYVQFGWPEHCLADLKSFNKDKLELSTLNGCIIYGSRVLIPSQGRQQILAELHQGHPGVNRMKGLARMYFWWPGLTKDIEKMVKGCAKCQENQSNPAVAPLEPWTWPTRPWARVHVDYAGPFMNSMSFIVTDAYSKWVEIKKTSSTTSTATIQMLRTIFTHYGLPSTLVSDNGTCFTSQEFEDFLKVNGIQHIKTAPYHPQSNGLAERMVQTFKKGMKKISSGTVDTKLAQFLLSNNSTQYYRSISGRANVWTTIEN